MRPGSGRSVRWTPSWVDEHLAVSPVYLLRRDDEASRDILCGISAS